ncbi:MAG: hypothetical protein U0975_10325 [Erythrobacter sp.]|nr:hypothetical protein [Erythrobacter sp.]MDZ4273059.1 hypothetical protein [Erythrobacter sp.]
MTILPCQANAELRRKIVEFAEVLKTEAHNLGGHGLSEYDFYESGLFRGAIERVRGQFSATMREKREFIAHVLNWMEERGYVAQWESAGESNRHDYLVTMPSGRVAAIELKGCLDGNNTNIFERPPQCNEFVVWSVCQNPGADPRHNAWSGIHTRLSAEIISRGQQVDGLIIWDMVCGTIGRPCPKIEADEKRLTSVGPFKLPPPCIFLFPATIPSPRNNPNPTPHSLEGVEFLHALHAAFGGREQETNKVGFNVGYSGNDTMRTTAVERGGVEVAKSEPTPIRRS